MKQARKKLCRAPRNPLVVAAKFRKAGAHGKSEKALRRTEKIKVGKLLQESLQAANGKP